MKEELIERYRERLVKELQLPKSSFKPAVSKEYKEFKEEMMPVHISLYEQLCNLSEKAIRIKPDKQKEKVLKEAIETCHLDVRPAGVVSFSILAPIVFIVAGSIFSYLAFQSLFFVAFFLLIGLAMITPLTKLPE